MYRKALTRFIALALLSATATLYAQSDNGSITGYAKDPGGAVIPGAKVSIVNEATGIVSSAN
jgi:hypothetical protein